MGSIMKRNCSSSPSPGPAPNPDPKRWEVMAVFQFENAHVMQVRYLDCTNYEGVKVMVFSGKYKPRLVLDPHFSESNDSPIARFRPDSSGLERACDFAEEL